MVKTSSVTSEKGLEIPVLKIIKDLGPCNTRTIIENIDKYCSLKIGDKKRYPSRGMNERKIDQITRNLVGSHFKTNGFDELVDKVGTKFKINKKGEALLLNLKQEDDDTNTNNYAESISKVLKGYNSKQLIKADNRDPVASIGKSSKKFARDPKIAKTVIENEGAKCSINSCTTFKKKDGSIYCEAHHFIPMSAQDEFLNFNLDRSDNIILVCSNCHSALHYGSPSVKKNNLKKAVLKNKKLSNVMNETFKDLDELINKYY